MSDTAKPYLEERKVRRHAAARYAGSLLTWREVLAWMQKHTPGDTRTGRINGELLVTLEAFDDMPGDDIQQFTNALGETLYRKRVQINGAPTLEIKISALAEPEPKS